MAAQHHLAMGINFALEHDRAASLLKSQIETANSGKEGRQPHGAANLEGWNRWPIMLLSTSDTEWQTVA